MRIKLMKHQYISCCWAVLTLIQGLSSFSDCPASEEAEAEQKEHKELGWGRTKLAKGIPCTQWYNDEQRNWGGSSRVCHCSRTGWPTTGWWWETSLCITCFFFFFYFFFLINTYLNCWVLTLTPYSNLSTIPLSESEKMAVWYLTDYWVELRYSVKSS